MKCVVCSLKDVNWLLSALPSELCSSCANLQRRWRRAQRALPSDDWVFEVLDSEFQGRLH